MRSSGKRGLLASSLVMAAAMLGMSQPQVATDRVSADRQSAQQSERSLSEAVKAEKKNKTTKIASLGSRYYRYFKFPRSRKTTTAARLKRQATKRRNIAKRGQK